MGQVIFVFIERKLKTRLASIGAAPMDVKIMLRKYRPYWCLALPCCIERAKGEPDMTNQPNILMIMTDQHRADWLGCNSSGREDTPYRFARRARRQLFQFKCCDTRLHAQPRLDPDWPVSIGSRVAA